MTGLFYLFGATISGTFLTILQNAISKDRVQTFSDSLIYQLIIYVVCTVIMGMAGGLRAFATDTLLLGLLSGILLVAEVASTMEAFRLGSMSLTNMFVMASMIVPIIFAGVLWGEQVTGNQMIGTALTLCSMAMILNLYTEFRRKKDGVDRDESFGISREWILFAVTAFLSAGCQGIVQKYQTVSEHSGELMSFLFIGFATASLLTFLLLLYLKYIKIEKVTLRLTPLLTGGMLLSGLLMSALHLTYLRSLELLPITLAVAGTSGVRLILLTGVDMVFFGQKLSVEQLLGIIVGVMAICFLSI